MDKKLPVVSRLSGGPFILFEHIFFDKPATLINSMDEIY